MPKAYDLKILANQSIRRLEKFYMKVGKEYQEFELKDTIQKFTELVTDEKVKCKFPKCKKKFESKQTHDNWFKILNHVNEHERKIKSLNCLSASVRKRFADRLLYQARSSYEAIDECFLLSDFQFELETDRPDQVLNDPPATEVFLSPIHRYGLRLKEDVRRFTFIMEYVGSLHLIEYYDEYLTNIEPYDYTYGVRLDDVIVDAGLYGNNSRFINHDCKNSNCFFVVYSKGGYKRLGVFSSKTIESGTELTLDYEPESNTTEGVRCNCTPKCKTILTLKSLN